MTILAGLAILTLFAALVAVYAWLLCRLDAAEQRGYARGQESERRVQEWARNAERRANRGPADANAPRRAQDDEEGGSGFGIGRVNPEPGNRHRGPETAPQDARRLRRDIPAFLRTPDDAGRSA